MSDEPARNATRIDSAAVANAAPGVPAAPLKRPWSGLTALASWRPVWSVPAALRAVRAAIVVPGLFAFSDQVIGNLQVATFAAFGGFATLVLASFAGSRRDELVAHAGMAVTGSVLLTIGTAVSGSTVLAAIVTVPVTFTVFFAGVIGPNAASGATGVLLAYVLPAASPGTVAMIPDRLAGWWLASVAGTAAVLVLSPRPGTDRLRAAAAGLASSLADGLDGWLAGSAPDEQLAATMRAKHELLVRFTATPYRPTGLAAPDEAFANAIELLEWCTDLCTDAIHERADVRAASPADLELLKASASALRGVESLFAGGDVRPDLGRLERARDRSVEELSNPDATGPGSRAAAQLSFHAHAIAVSVLAVAGDALLASRLADPDRLEAQRRLWPAGSRAARATTRRVSAVASVAMRHASVRSTWLVNSVRGSVALAAAVAVADLISVQHGFWVVLGTLSVLRTNAGATGATALRALAGTAIGFALGGLLLVAIGSTSVVLWVVLPIAVFVAAYAPGTAPFAVGQAAFTVTVVILFNLLVPVGWKVGVVRVEDVALGCAVSIAVGLLFWPRGLSSVVGDDLADAYRAGATYLRQAVEWASSPRAVEPEGAAAAVAAASRLDAALRGFLSEQGSKRIGMQELWRLVGGSLRLRLTARSIAALPRDPTLAGDARAAITNRTNTLASWFERLAELVGRPRERAIEALAAPSSTAADVLAPSSSSEYGVWLCEHLDHLSEHLAELVQPATRVAEVRRRPWWR